MAINFGAVLAAVLDQVIPLLELVATLIILGGGVWALIVFARRRDAGQARREFSHALLLGLDYTIGADMLKLAIAPNLSAAALGRGGDGGPHCAYADTSSGRASGDGVSSALNEESILRRVRRRKSRTLVEEKPFYDLVSVMQLKNKKE